MAWNLKINFNVCIIILIKSQYFLVLCDIIVYLQYINTYGGFPYIFAGDKESTCSAGVAGDAGLILGSGRSLGGSYDNPPQYSWLENPMDRGTWWAAVHRVAKSRRRLKWLSMHKNTHTHTHTQYFLTC